MGQLWHYHAVRGADVFVQKSFVPLAGVMVQFGASYFAHGAELFCPYVEERSGMKKSSRKKQNTKSPSDSIRAQIKQKKGLATVYFLLRLSVILTMVAQIYNRNFENVYLCVLTLVLFMLPAIFERKLHIDVPDTLEVIVLLFIYAAEILGEIREYYIAVPFWDDLLHTTNGFLCAAIGFSLVNLLNKDERVEFQLSPAYMALMAFCFSMTIGVLWEFFEWGADTFLHADMQKDEIIHAINSVNLDPLGRNVPHYISDITDVILVQADGTQRALGLGGYLDIGLIDTMTDLFVNFIGATVFSLIGYFCMKFKKRSNIVRSLVPRKIKLGLELSEGEDANGCAE